MNRIRTLHLVALTVLSLAAIPAMAAENYLLASHKQRLEKARFEESAAKSTWDKAFALRQQAAELDSMGKSAEALTVIDRALSLIKPEKDKDFIATKASILFSMNDPRGALALLAPQLEATREYAASQAAAGRTLALGTFTEGFVTATFAHIQLEQKQAAYQQCLPHGHRLSST